MIRLDLPEDIRQRMLEGIENLRPAQEKALASGLLEGKSVLVCTPTASGKTLIAEMAAAKTLVSGGKVVYVVPLKALASEKSKEFKRKYQGLFRIALSIGDLDSPERRLGSSDLIICTSEKLDSLLRHDTPWLREVRLLVIDEIHLLNDTSRGPTLEIIVTMLRQVIPTLQILGLSATIGNPQELAAWLKAELVMDDWRPVELRKGIYLNGEVEFY
jgi:helicase